MRRSVMLGTALMVAGGTVFLRGLSAKGQVARFGDLSVPAYELNSIVPWAAILAVIGGLVIITAGTRWHASH